METRYWIKRYDKHSHAPEEIADLMFLAKGQQSMIANREIPVIEESIKETGHVFKYKPVQGMSLTGSNCHGNYVTEIQGELTDAQRSKTVESMFNMHHNEILRLRKKLPVKKIKRKPMKRNYKKD